MKTLVIFFLLSLTAAVLSAQKVTVLDEARLFYAPVSIAITNDGDSYVYEINESSKGQFAKDPIGFMKANFDIKNFINYTAHKKYHSYLVTFKSTNGSMMADFDKNGNLLRTVQQFKNVILPVNIRNEVHSDFKGYALTKANYTARTKGEKLAKATYKIQLVNGKDKQNLKIDATKNGIGVALN